MNIVQLMQTMKTSNNPLDYLESQKANNPVIAKALEMMRGKSPDEIMRVAENLAKSQGVNIDDVRKKLGV